MLDNVLLPTWEDTRDAIYECFAALAAPTADADYLAALYSDDAPDEDEDRLLAIWRDLSVEQYRGYFIAVYPTPHGWMWVQSSPAEWEWRSSVGAFPSRSKARLEARREILEDALIAAVLDVSTELLIVDWSQIWNR